MSHCIQFYRVGDPYGEFSNFAAAPFVLEEREWPTAKHYFQAKKFEGSEYEELVRQAKTPMLAAQAGRNREFPLRSDWETVKDDVMRRALRAKFVQHEKLKALLLSTGDAELVEHRKNDR